jgi:hypothetical protein
LKENQDGWWGRISLPVREVRHSFPFFVTCRSQTSVQPLPTTNGLRLAGVKQHTNTGIGTGSRSFGEGRYSMRLGKMVAGFAACSALAWLGALQAAEPKPIAEEQFDKLLRMIKPQTGESRFQEIPWLLSVHEARQKAAAEGKPMLVWAGAGGAPVGVC